MKQVVILIVLVIASFSAEAQVEAHTFGTRLGGGNYGSEMGLSYQHRLSRKGRVELGVDLHSTNGNSYAGFATTYQFVFDINGGFNGYLGAGAQYLLVPNSSAVGLGGVIGAEYNFNENRLPLLVSLDLRPMYMFFDEAELVWGAGVSIRYTF
jgi:hypothetical protein